MARNDYFVIAYRILAYLYRCFMRGDRPNIDEYDPDALGISNGYWVNMMESLSDEAEGSEDLEDFAGRWEKVKANGVSKGQSGCENGRCDGLHGRRIIRASLTAECKI